MVQLLLKPGSRLRFLVVLALVLVVQAEASKAKKPDAPVAVPDLLLEGGRKLVFESAFSSEREVNLKPGFWKRVVNVIAGEPDYHALINPYSIAVDSHGRLIITDPGSQGVHIFDFARRKYKFLSRIDKSKDAMRTPQCVAVDAKDNIYVTDSNTGKIFVFDADGKFRRAIGSIKGGEGFFKRPTGIAIDPETQRIYVTDTLRNQIFLLDTDGKVLQRLGKPGTEQGEFNFPTELLVRHSTVAVVDAMNFRVQLLDRSGQYKSSFGAIGDTNEATFRPKAIGVDSEGHYYVVEGLWAMVQVFDESGRLLYYFGRKGTALGQFQLPTGLAIDKNDRIYVVDSFNRRVQVFQYHAISKSANGGQP
jgi:DNA-binding beta-propeller fold protein YncE